MTDGERGCVVGDLAVVIDEKGYGGDDDCWVRKVPRGVYNAKRGKGLDVIELCGNWYSWMRR